MTKLFFSESKLRNSSQRELPFILSALELPEEHPNRDRFLKYADLPPEPKEIEEHIRDTQKKIDDTVSYFLQLSERQERERFSKYDRWVNVVLNRIDLIGKINTTRIVTAPDFTASITMPFNTTAISTPCGCAVTISGKPNAFQKFLAKHLLGISI